MLSENRVFKTDFVEIMLFLYALLFCSYYGQVIPDVHKSCPTQCSCHNDTVDCSKRSLVDLIGLDYKLEKFHRVDISLNEFRNIPFLRVTSLNVSYNSITELPEYTEDVDELYLRNNLIRHGFMTSDRLKVLDISHNPLQKLSFVLRGLQVLDVSNGDIEVIPENFLENLPSLKIVNLSDNPLKRLPELRSHSLKELWLERTHIRLFKPSTFIQLSQLKILNLRENKHLQKLHIESSVELLLAENGFIEEVNLTGTPQLKTVSLNNNRIQSLILSNRVHEIHVRNNYLKNFHFHKYIRTADLSNNFLTSLNFFEMEWLNISGNPITHIKLKSVDYLDASRCSINAIECTRSRFRYLNLSNNYLESFPCSIAVKVLDISYNRLTSLKTKLQEVQELNLTGNRIVEAEDLIPQGKMYLSDNPWTCDCKMKPLYNVAEDLNSLQCVHPKNVSGLTWAAACSSTKVQNWMRRHPFIPFVISCIILFTLGFLIYWIKVKLDNQTAPTEEEHVVPSVHSPRPIQPSAANELPSYEEALLMPAVMRKTHALTQTRSYEILSHRLSSSSI